MKRRSNGSINAGSMADIAFLLLIFFLVTTTLATDEGIIRTLPPPVDDDDGARKITDQNLLDVKTNDNNQISVDGDVVEIAAVKELAKDFFQNTENKPSLPQRRLVTLDSARSDVKTYQAALAANPSSGELKSKLKKAETRLLTVQLIGPYQGFPAEALVAIETGSRSSYELYVQLQGELNAALDELRDDFCTQHFNCRFDQLDAMREDDQNKILAVRTVYPMRIVEAEPPLPTNANTIPQ